MVTPLTYTTYQQQLAIMAVVEPTDANFLAALPMTINYAELSCYRDLDLLVTTTSDPVYSTTADNNQLVIPEGDFITIQDINILTPSGQSNPLNSTRKPLTMTTKEVLYNLYPNAAVPGVPAWAAVLTQWTFLLGPWPDDVYIAEVIGTQRPASLSNSQATTFLSTYLPDLFMAASMVYISGYQRNFGKQADDPQMSVNWLGEYKRLLESAGKEEMRKKFQSEGWSAYSAATTATPSRGNGAG